MKAWRQRRSTAWALQRLIDDQRRTVKPGGGQHCALIAELLIDCAACRRSVVSEKAAEQQAISQLRDAIRQREQRCVEALLKLYGFRTSDAAAR